MNKSVAENVCIPWSATMVNKPDNRFDSVVAKRIQRYIYCMPIDGMPGIWMEALPYDRITHGFYTQSSNAVDIFKGPLIVTAVV